MSRGRFDGQAQPNDFEAAAVSHYWLRVGTREVPLGDGETLLGRGDGCGVVVNEAMVSRRHARIVVGSGRPYIEDLGSANGTFVNQGRLKERAELFPGDRIFIGTCEIEVILRLEEDRPTVPIAEDELDRATPSSGVGAFDPVSGGRATLPRGHVVGGVVREEEAKTLESFEGLTHLADKMFTMGRVDAALRILGEPLEALREGARLGHIPAAPLLDALGRYAVKLANDTLDGYWVDLAIEAHLLAVRPLREETIQQLAALRGKAPIGSDELIARYYARLRSVMTSFSSSERILSERVACLLPALGP
jgi:hypothetical protein